MSVGSDLAVDEAVGILTPVEIVQGCLQGETLWMVLCPERAKAGIPEKDVLEGPARAQPGRKQGRGNRIPEELGFRNVQRRLIKPVLHAFSSLARFGEEQQNIRSPGMAVRTGDAEFFGERREPFPEDILPERKSHPDQILPALCAAGT